MGFLFGEPSKQTSNSSSTSSSSSGNSAFGILNNALSPTLGYGAQAGSMMAGLLGLPQGAPSQVVQNQTPPAGYNPQTPGFAPPAYPGVGGGFGSIGDGGFGENSEDPNHLSAKFNSDGGLSPRFLLNENQPQPQSQGLPTGDSTHTATLTGSAPGAASALDNFSNSAGIDFMRDQGVKAIEASQAGRGMLQSGATGQALASFGNNLGKTYLNDYLSHLMDYASLGTKNAAVLSGSGGYSNSNGLSSGTGSGTGPKNGLVQDIGQIAQIAGAFA